jgi:hypothetical protein
MPGRGEDCSAGETKVEVFNKHSAWESAHKSVPTTNLLGMPHNRAQTALYWGCTTIGLTRTWRKNAALPGT